MSTEPLAGPPERPMVVTRGMLAQRVAARTNTTYETADATLRAALDIAADALAQGRVVKLTGFGVLTPVLRPERTEHNPATGESVIKPPCVLVRFASDARLRSRVKPQDDAAASQP